MKPSMQLLSSQVVLTYARDTGSCNLRAPLCLAHSRGLNCSFPHPKILKRFPSYILLGPFHFLWIYAYWAAVKLTWCSSDWVILLRCLGTLTLHQIVPGIIFFWTMGKCLKNKCLRVSKHFQDFGLALLRMWKQNEKSLLFFCGAQESSYLLRQPHTGVCPQ